MRDQHVFLHRAIFIKLQQITNVVIYVNHKTNSNIYLLYNFFYTFLAHLSKAQSEPYVCRPSCVVRRVSSTFYLNAISS